LPCTSKKSLAEAGGILLRSPGGVIYNKIAFARGSMFEETGDYVVEHPPCHSYGLRYVWTASLIPPAWNGSLPDWLLRHLVEGTNEGISSLLAKTYPGRGCRRRAQQVVCLSCRSSALDGVDPDVTLELFLLPNEVRCRPLMPLTRLFDCWEHDESEQTTWGAFWCWLRGALSIARLGGVSYLGKRNPRTERL
jgi:hypothetical protein